MSTSTTASPPNRFDKETANQLITNTRWIFRFAWKINRRLLVSVIILSLVASIIPAVQALIVRNVINMLVAAVRHPNGSFRETAIWLGILLALTLAQTILNFFSDRSAYRLRAAIEYEVNVDLLVHTSKLDLAQFQDSVFQDMMSRANDNIGGRVSGYLSNVINLSVSIFQILSLIVLLVAIDPIAVIAVLPLAIPYIW